MNELIHLSILILRYVMIYFHLITSTKNLQSEKQDYQSM